MDQSKYIRLYESCQLTRGVRRTLLLDSQRNTMEFLDNEIYTMLTQQSRKQSVGQILSGLDDGERAIAQEYFEFLLEKEYAFLCEARELDFFPEISRHWDYPAAITNSIIDLDRVPAELSAYKTFIKELSGLGCENLQIRDFSGLPLDLIRTLLQFAEDTVIFRIELILKYSTGLEAYATLLSEFPRINELVVHSFPEDMPAPEATPDRLLISRQILSDASCCGVVSPKYFNLDFDHFLESVNYNSCLNRKIALDVNGNIKNCPSMRTDFGRVGQASIRDVISKPEYAIAGSLKKDLIEDCQVCEFRHICTDCRAFLESDHSLKKPAKCGYDPYTLAWT